MLHEKCKECFRLHKDCPGVAYWLEGLGECFIDKIDEIKWIQMKLKKNTEAMDI